MARAFALVPEQNIPRDVYNHWTQELGYRRKRLSGKGGIKEPVLGITKRRAP